jgi:hypothetical protein
MGKSQETFSKKEKQKKKLKERQEKREKMQERKANTKKGKSLDEMMAYVDENGHISATPPDPKKKKVWTICRLEFPNRKNVLSRQYEKEWLLSLMMIRGLDLSMTWKQKNVFLYTLTSCLFG